MSEDARDDEMIDETAEQEETMPCDEQGTCPDEESVEEAERAIELAEELQQMTVLVNALESRVSQLENSIAVIVEAGATVMETSPANTEGTSDDDDDFLYLEDLDYYSFMREGH